MHNQADTLSSESGFVSLINDLTPDTDVIVPLNTSGATSLSYRMVRDGRTYFVKRLKSELAYDARHLHLFDKEYEIGSHLDSPYLVRYYSKEVLPTGEPQILMEYIEGDTLDVALTKDTVFFSTPGNIRKILIQILEALKYLHTRQILHLDIKPQNIMLTRINHDVKIIDFGFSYSSAFQTSMGLSKAFAAPEQSDGSGYVDELCDIHAFGKLVAYILDNTQINSKSFCRRLKKISSKCCKNVREERYQSIDEILAELNTHIKSGLVVAAIAAACFTAIMLLSFTHAARYVHRMLYGYDFTFNQNHYVILSDDSATCEVVSYDSLTTLHNLEDIIIPANVLSNGVHYDIVSIGDSAYYMNKRLQMVSFANGLKTIGEAAFWGCHGLRSIHLPETVTEVMTAAFANCPNITEIILSPNLKVITHTCFHQTGISSIDIPEGVHTIEQDAFVDSRNLSEVRLPSTLRTLERGVFFKCPKLREITIPEAVTTIGDYCFVQCPEFRVMYNMNPAPQKVIDLFDDPKLVTVFVPAHSVALYKKAPYWCECNIKAIE